MFKKKKKLNFDSALRSPKSNNNGLALEDVNHTIIHKLRKKAHVAQN